MKALFREMAFWLSVMVDKKKSVYEMNKKNIEDNQFEINIEQHEPETFPDSIYEDDEVALDEIELLN